MESMRKDLTKNMDMIGLSVCFEAFMESMRNYLTKNMDMIGFTEVI